MDVGGDGLVGPEPLMSFAMLDNLITTAATMGLTNTSPNLVLQCGSEAMHEASTTFCSFTLRVFQSILAASKSNSCPGCEHICLNIELFILRFWISFLCSQR